MSTWSNRARFGVYSPASIGWGGKYDPKNNPDLLERFTFNGVTYGSMHKLVIPLFTDLFTQLVPLIPGGLVKGQCGCYNPGSVTVGGDRSFHTYGIATDTNWGSNPMYHKGRPKGQHCLPAKTSSIAHSLGMEWGGDWSYPQDWMHIEVHLSPADCIAYARARKPSKPAPAKTRTFEDIRRSVVPVVVTTTVDTPKAQRAHYLLDGGVLTHIATPADSQRFQARFGAPVAISEAQFRYCGGKR